jgi:hypothetical protein
MSKKDFLTACRASAETVTLKNGQVVQIRKFTQGELEAILRSTEKVPERVRALAMQTKLIAKTVTIGDEELTESEVNLDLDADVTKELSDHVARVNGMNRKPEDVAGE